MNPDQVFRDHRTARVQPNDVHDQSIDCKLFPFGISSPMDMAGMDTYAFTSQDPLQLPHGDTLPLSLSLDPEKATVWWVAT
jgi:hypothetical protein